jgi:predicted dehydrogenase
VNPIRCAVIGCGRIGCGFDDNSSKIIRTHAGSYYKNSQTNLVALCDKDKTKLKKYGEKYNISKLYQNSSKMFEKENIDCVSICTLVETHLELVKQAAKFNVKGIFLEKPISSNLKQAQEIINICKKNKIFLMIDHQRRFDPFYNNIQQLINQKKIGEIQTINVYYGSGIANTGSHLFDLIRLFFGETISLKSNLSKNNSNNSMDPNFDIRLELSNEVICNIIALNYKNYGLLEMDIIGSTGRIKLNLASNQIEYFKIDNTDSIVYKKLTKSKMILKKSKQSSIQLGIKNLIEAIKTNKKLQCTGFDGYKSLELIIASINSAKKGKKVELPLTNKNYNIDSK